MSVITLPTSLGINHMAWGQQRRDMAFSSVFGSQAAEVSPPLWTVNLTAAPEKEATVGAWKSLLMVLRGRVNQLELWDKQRPAPVGTMRGTMTLNIAAAQGDVSLSIIAATEAAKTLKQGDLLGLGSGITQQVVMVMADATADGSGIISVTTEPPLRNAFVIASAVIWDRPKALFRVTSPKTQWDYAPGSMTSGMTLDLIEDWRP